ncbi:MAG: two-component sensor histidine kinase, partial [Acidimicrobiales bacterium]
PGAKVSVSLEFRPNQVCLSVLNGPAGSAPVPIAVSGAGYGLQGVRERILLLAGTVEAGPTEDLGWRVHTAVPG